MIRKSTTRATTRSAPRGRPILPKTNKSKTITTIETRRKRKEIMPKLSIGKIPGNFQSNIQFASEKEMTNLVNSINYGPQIVSIPVPPWRHAFLIDIQKNKKKIIISDWGGANNMTAGIINSQNYEAGWEQYYDLLIRLKKKYNYPIEYFPIDKEIYNISFEHNKQCKGGGCSHYIFQWINKYYPEYI